MSLHIYIYIVNHSCKINDPKNQRSKASIKTPSWPPFWTTFSRSDSARRSDRAATLLRRWSRAPKPPVRWAFPARASHREPIPRAAAVASRPPRGIGRAGRTMRWRWRGGGTNDAVGLGALFGRKVLWEKRKFD